METVATNYPGKYWFKVSELIDYFTSKIDEEHEMRDYDEYRKKRGKKPIDFDFEANEESAFEYIQFLYGNYKDSIEKRGIDFSEYINENPEFLKHVLTMSDVNDIYFDDEKFFVIKPKSYNKVHILTKKSNKFDSYDPSDDVDEKIGDFEADGDIINGVRTDGLDDIWENDTRPAVSGSGSDKWFIVDEKLWEACKDAIMKKRGMMYYKKKSYFDTESGEYEPYVVERLFRLACGYNEDLDDYPKDALGDEGFAKIYPETLLRMNDVYEILKGREIEVLEPQLYTTLLLTKNDFMFEGETDEDNVGYFFAGRV